MLLHSYLVSIIQQNKVIKKLTHHVSLQPVIEVVQQSWRGIFPRFRWVRPSTSPDAPLTERWWCCLSQSWVRLTAGPGSRTEPSADQKYHCRLQPSNNTSATSTTSCCSPVSERPHHYCHIPNNFGWQWAGRWPQNCPLGDLDHHLTNVLTNGYLALPDTTSPNGISTGWAVLAWIMVMTNRHTQTTEHWLEQATSCYAMRPNKLLQ